MTQTQEIGSPNNTVSKAALSSNCAHSHLFISEVVLWIKISPLELCSWLCCIEKWIGLLVLVCFCHQQQEVVWVRTVTQSILGQPTEVWVQVLFLSPVRFVTFRKPHPLTGTQFLLKEKWNTLKTTQTSRFKEHTTHVTQSPRAQLPFWGSHSSKKSMNVNFVDLVIKHAIL